MTSDHPIAWRDYIESAIAGEKSDRIPAVFRLDKWYQARAGTGSLPNELAGMSLEGVEGYLGLGRSARSGRVFKKTLHPPVECVQRRKGELVITEWRTPSRILSGIKRYGPGDEEAGLLPTVVEYPIKDWADYAAYEEIVWHTEFVACYEDYKQYDQMVGEAGLPMVILGPVPFHDLLLNWVGYERGYVHLYDRPEVVLQAVEATEVVFRRMWDMVAKSPARLIMHGVNFDTQMTSPPIFREHFLPYLKQFNRLMHTVGKKVAFHADGDMSGLLELMLEADYDVADCFACDPLVRCTMAEARAAWRDRVTIWGGLPSFMLEPAVSLEKLRDHLEQVYRAIAPGERFILGISDQAMPTASWEHVALASRWAGEHSCYPIDLP